MLDVLHLGSCFDVGHVGLRQVIGSLSAAGTNQEGVRVTQAASQM